MKLWLFGQHRSGTSARLTQRVMPCSDSLKRQKMAEYPDDDVEKWRSYLLRLMPIADPASLEKLFEGFRNAGLPV